MVKIWLIEEKGRRKWGCWPLRVRRGRGNWHRHLWMSRAIALLDSTRCCVAMSFDWGCWGLTFHPAYLLVRPYVETVWWPGVSETPAMLKLIRYLREIGRDKMDVKNWTPFLCACVRAFILPFSGPALALFVCEMSAPCLGRHVVAFHAALPVEARSLILGPHVVAFNVVISIWDRI